MVRRVVYGDQPRYLAWAEERIGQGPFRDDAKAIGLERDGELIASAVFDTFSKMNCFISIASDGSRRWLNREFLIRVFAYPFLQCGHARVSSIIAADNEPSIRLCEHIGFRREGVLRRAAWGGRDLLLLGMLDDECRWLPRR